MTSFSAAICSSTDGGLQPRCVYDDVVYVLTVSGVECSTAGDQPQLRTRRRSVDCLRRESMLRYFLQASDGELEIPRFGLDNITRLQLAQAPENERSRCCAVHMTHDDRRPVLSGS